jgi:hypothetical protein
MYWNFSLLPVLPFAQNESKDVLIEKKVFGNQILE